MAKKTISANIVGTPGTHYDLDELEKNSRTNSEKTLVVQVWKYNPKSEDETKRSPNPPNLKIGQIWLSKRVDDE